MEEDDPDDEEDDDDDEEHELRKDNDDEDERVNGEGDKEAGSVDGRETRCNRKLVPGLGAVVPQRGNEVGCVDGCTSNCPKYVTFVNAVHDHGMPWHMVVMLGFVCNSTIILALI